MNIELILNVTYYVSNTDFLKQLLKSKIYKTILKPWTWSFNFNEIKKWNPNVGLLLSNLNFTSIYIFFWYWGEDKYVHTLDLSYVRATLWTWAVLSLLFFWVIFHIIYFDILYLGASWLTIMRTEYMILFLYGKIQIKENSYSGIL